MLLFCQEKRYCMKRYLHAVVLKGKSLLQEKIASCGVVGLVQKL
jgi:hypothetical protein